MNKLIIEGKDNSNKPRREYADKISAMTDDELFKEAEQNIWLSVYAANNPRSDYHWHCDATWSESQRRNKPEIYSKAFEKASRM